VHRLNPCIRQIRAALDDDADKSGYMETYRVAVIDLSQGLRRCPRPRRPARSSGLRLPSQPQGEGGWACRREPAANSALGTAVVAGCVGGACSVFKLANLPLHGDYPILESADLLHESGAVRLRRYGLAWITLVGIARQRDRKQRSSQKPKTFIGKLLPREIPDKTISHLGTRRG
jgi:hypothetical protein